MKLKSGLPALPRRMQSLPIDHRGFPVPWFVAFIDGKPDFRVIAPGRISDAHRKKLCWCCGQPLGVNKAFVIGPMCAINRVSSEPPSHFECAEFSAKACPFLTQPRMRRNEKNLPDDAKSATGTGIKRNPGVALIWITTSYSVIRVGDGVLFNVGDAERVVWLAEGRRATRDEVLASIESGLPILMEDARRESDAAVFALGRMTGAAMKLVPA